MENFVDKLFDRSMTGLQKSLDLYWKRNEAIVSNLSNAETPAYRAVDVNFADELNKAFGDDRQTLKTTRAGHMNMGGGDASHLVPDFSGTTRPDGNNVDLDIQMGKLSQNSGRYTIAASLVRKKLHMLRTAMRYAMQ